MTAMLLISRINGHFDIRMTIAAVFKSRTVSSMADLIESLRPCTDGGYNNGPEGDFEETII